MSVKRIVLSVATAALLAACGAAEEELFGEYPSSDRKHVLRITVAESQVPNADFYVFAYLLDGSGTSQRLIETRRANDGVPFSQTNVAVRWVSPRQALICLRPTDLPDRGLRIDLEPAPRVIEVDRC